MWLICWSVNPILAQPSISLRPFSSIHLSTLATTPHRPYTTKAPHFLTYAVPLYLLCYFSSLIIAYAKLDKVDKVDTF
nr:MAG TPA: hypothetical protein [Caudoviricetes sp.]